jgi:hypothetical protein
MQTSAPNDIASERLMLHSIVGLHGLRAPERAR